MKQAIDGMGLRWGRVLAGWLCVLAFGLSPAAALAQDGATEPDTADTSAASPDNADGEGDGSDEATPDVTEDPEGAMEGAGEEIADKASEGADALLEGDFATFWENYSDLFEKYVLPAVTALVILIVAYFLGKYLSRIASGPVRKRVDETLGKFVGKLIFYAVMVIALVAVLDKFGVSVTSLAAVLAAAGFAVGLAFQGTLSNFAAGVMLLVFRPFKVGDVCVLNGTLGKINAVDLFVTAIDTLDNRRIIMPNSEISGSTIEVITHHPERRVEVVVGTAYEADIDKTRDVLEATLGKVEGVIQGEGRGTTVVLDELGGSSVNWKLWAWVPAADFLGLKQQITRDVKVALDEAGISIPYPQMDVHVDGAMGGYDVNAK